MNLDRKQLRRMILNELFGGKKMHGFLKAIKNSKRKELVGLEKELSMDEVVTIKKEGYYKGRRAAIGQSKIKSGHFAKQKAKADGIKKLNLQGSVSGIDVPFGLKVGDITYVLVIAPKEKSV